MSDTILTFLIFLGIFTVGALVFILFSKSKKQEQARQEIFRQRGWHYEKNPLGGYTLTGANHGINWEFKVVSDDSTGSTTWRTDTILEPEPAALIMGKESADAMKGTFGQATLGLASTLLKNIVKTQIALFSLLEKGEYMELSHPSAQQKFRLIGIDTDKAKALRGFKEEELLLNWPKPDNLQIILGAPNLEISVTGEITRPEHVIYLVDLGVGFARRYQENRRIAQ